MLPPSSGGVNDMAKSEDHEIDDVQLCLIWVYIMTISSKVIESNKSKVKIQFGLPFSAKIWFSGTQN